MVRGFSLSSVLPFNKQALRPWGTGVTHRGESGMKPSPHGSPPVPQGRNTSRDSPLDSFGILIVGALWRKSWKANWMWRLEAVREPGPGGVRASRRWPLIPDEREGCCCGWWGWRCCWFLCENQSFYHQLRGRKGKAWKGVVQFCFKGISLCRVFSNLFMMVLLLLRVYDKP